MVSHMIDVKAFEMEHLEAYYPKYLFEDLDRDMKKNIMDPNKLIFSLLWKGKTLAILGLTEFRKGVGEVWILPSIYVDHCKFGFYKVVKSMLYDFVFNELKYHRIEIAILKGWDQGMKWARSLGFKKSHVCEAYDNLYRDHVIFTRIKRWHPAQQ